MITNHQADILRHTSNNGRFVGDHNATMAELTEAGLLFDHGPQRLAGGDHCYVTTTKGREALNEWQRAQPKPKVRRRSPSFQEWRDYTEATCSRMTFPAFLKRKKEHAL